MATTNHSRKESPLSSASPAKLQPSKTTWSGHPILRGGNPPYPHQFGHQHMKALAALCETFVPSIGLNTSDRGTNVVSSEGVEVRAEEAVAKGSLDDVDAFYRLSSSDVGLPAEVAGHLFRTLKPQVLLVMRFLLWMLTTSVGTLLLFGTMSLSWRYPFILNFLEFTPEQREKALLSWLNSKISIFAKFFKLFKGYSMFCFYAKVDENGHNPCWNAIGYCGADPKASEMEDCAPKPLEGKVLDPEISKEKLASLLVDGGFPLLDDISHLRQTSHASAKNKGNRGLLSRQMGVKCDIVVVGSGSGGGVIAGSLAQAGYKVLVLEKGRYFARGDLTLLEGPSMTAMYEGSGTLSTDDGNVNILAGTTVGGGSAINWAASLQTPEHVRQEWAKDHGLSFFTTQVYQQALDEVCARGAVNSTCKEESFQNQALGTGCKKLGYDVEQLPRNTKGEHSCGWCNFGCKNGAKQATTETWLVDAVQAGALILSNCRVREVLLREGGSKERKAVGVIGEWGDDLTLYVEAKVTVVCCGSLNTPPLLLKSGLKNPKIGRHLHIHPVTMGWGYFPEGQAPAGRSYDGAIMTAVCRATANWNSSGYGSLLEVPILHPGAFATLMPWRSGVDHKGRMRKFSRTAHFLVLTRDKGSGRVGLDIDGQLTKITYSVAAHDEDNILDGLENGLRAMLAAGAEEVGTQHTDGDTFSLKDHKSSSTLEEEFQKFLQGIKERRLGGGLKTPFSSAHQMGSCRMGVDSKESVVDVTGETWEVENLYLGDASVFPTASGVNPMITVQAIAMCTARNIICKLESDKL